MSHSNSIDKFSIKNHGHDRTFHRTRSGWAANDSKCNLPGTSRSSLGRAANGFRYLREGNTFEQLRGALAIKNQVLFCTKTLEARKVDLVGNFALENAGDSRDRQNWSIAEPESPQKYGRRWNQGEPEGELFESSVPDEKFPKCNNKSLGKLESH